MFGGIVNCYHDASIGIIDHEGNIDFASASERFVRIKHYSLLTASLLHRLEKCDYKIFYEDLTAYSKDERAFFPTDRWEAMVEKERRDYGLFQRYANTRYLKQIVTHRLDHHRSHAAATFFTRPWQSFDDTVILSMDGVGKDHMTANNIYSYDAKTNRFVSQHSDVDSIGTLYAAIAVYLRFGDFEEGSMMGLSSFGEPRHYDAIEKLYNYLYLGEGGNLYAESDDWRMYNETADFLDQHLGSRDTWRREDVAASAQKFLEDKVLHYAKKARTYGSRLCYSGGVAQNIIANSAISELFDGVWIVPDPTDGGCSLGAAAWAYAEETGKNRIKWIDAFLGHDIQRDVNPKEVVDYILTHKVCGVANGRAEFGPRALGNRSLIGDVRFDIKDTVNAIKKREPFRPFGPVILEEEFDAWFEGPTNEYMQYVCRPKHDLRSVIHVDGTSRVQTVPKNSRSVIRAILEEYFQRTGVPMLLNTSLNIKGEPMVNDVQDAEDFERRYGVRVF